MVSTDVVLSPEPRLGVRTEADSGSAADFLRELGLVTASPWVSLAHWEHPLPQGEAFPPTGFPGSALPASGPPHTVFLLPGMLFSLLCWETPAYPSKPCSNFSYL